MWRVSSGDGSRWVQYDGAGQVGAQPPELLLTVLGSAPVEIAPMTGDFYTPRRADDPVAVFLRARQVIGGRAVLSGQPPQVPAAAGGQVPGLAY